MFIYLVTLFAHQYKTVTINTNQDNEFTLMPKALSLTHQHLPGNQNLRVEI